MHSYQVFISFKHLDPKGKPTPDTKLAQQIYDYLTERGLRVFFSVASIEQLGNADFHRSVDTALESAQIMIVVGTSRPNLEARWVRYEWQSFHNEILGGLKSDGEIIVYTDQIQLSELPYALRQHQVIQHGAGTIEHLYRFIMNAMEKQAVPAPAAPAPEPIPPRPTLPPSAQRASTRPKLIPFLQRWGIWLGILLLAAIWLGIRATTQTWPFASSAQAALATEPVDIPSSTPQPVVTATFVPTDEPPTATETAPPPAVEGEPSAMQLIYDSLRIQDLTTDRSVYASGETVKISYKLVNQSDQTLVVPENDDYSQPYFLVGAQQFWIERLGDDSTIPSSTARDGSKYAAGGSILMVYGDNMVLEPSEAVELTAEYHTLNHAEGTYRYYVDYQMLDTQDVQVETIEFEIRGFLSTPVPTRTIPAFIPPTATPRYTEAEVLLDQVQDEVNYGFGFWQTDARWQEFTPSLGHLTAVEVYIGKEGRPGNLILEIKNVLGTILSSATVPDYHIEDGVGWLRVYLPEPVPVTPGSMVQISLRGELDNTYTDSAYTWYGNNASDYCRKCQNDVHDSWPEYDYAFHTFGY